MGSPYPVILHHFEKSPFSEKIRVAFGIKKIAWTSVLISRIMPRPDLMPMTGGYRRTPTLQIGADVYCDTQVILRELERRFPQPTLYPAGNAGIAWGLGMWTDRSFFQNTVNLVFGSLADQVPREFREDREQLRGQKFDVEAMKAAIPQMRDQLRAHADWIETQLNDGRVFLGGPSGRGRHPCLYEHLVCARQPAGRGKAVRALPEHAGVGAACERNRPWLTRTRADSRRRSRDCAKCNTADPDHCGCR